MKGDQINMPTEIQGYTQRSETTVTQRIGGVNRIRE